MVEKRWFKNFGLKTVVVKRWLRKGGKNDGLKTVVEKRWFKNVG